MHSACTRLCACSYPVAMLDINECADDKDGCSQICTNSEGSYECSCSDGYILDADGKNCLGTRVIYTL